MKLHIETGYDLSVLDVLDHLERFHAKLKERFEFEIQSNDHMTVEVKDLNNFLWLSNALCDGDFWLRWTVISNSDRHPEYPSFQKIVTVHKQLPF